MRINFCAVCLLTMLICGACGGGATKPATGNAPPANANDGSAGSNAQTAGTDTSAPVAGPAHAKAAPASPSSSSMGGGGQAIDTSKYDAEVARLQKQVDKKTGGEADRAALAHAYLERGNALTKARQYRAALGDYRHTLKYDPSNEEAKQMAGTIVSILQQMGRDVPQEGAEPSPLPYKQ